MNAVKDRIAVVAGGGNGMGKAIALMLAAEGAKVVVNDIAVLKDQGNQRAADITVAEIKAAGGDAVPNYDDISTMVGGANVIKTAIDAYGKIDILALIAGITCRKTLEEHTEADWDRVVGVNAKGYFAMIQAAAPYMKEQHYGRILCYASTAAFGYGKSISYSAGKGACLAMVGELGFELSGTGIHVNCVLPSATTTLFPGDKVAYGGKPRPDPATPDMVAPMSVYLCSEACQFTGECFHIGGCDVGLFPRERLPISLIRKGNKEKWTVEELNTMVPESFGWYFETKESKSAK